VIRTRDDLRRLGLGVSTGREWRVRVVFVDGSERVVRLSGRCGEESAVQRALLYLKVFDRSVVDRVDATMEEPDRRVASTGLITK